MSRGNELAGGWITDRNGRTEIHILGDNCWFRPGIPRPIPTTYHAAPSRRRAHDSVRRRGRRRDDASAGGVPGELRPGVAPPGDIDDVPEYGAGNEGEAPTGGGLNPQASEFVDARSLRLVGRDSNGRQWSARLFGPNGQEGWAGPPDMEDEMPPEIRTTADGRDTHVGDLRKMQAYLNRHYRH